MNSGLVQPGFVSGLLAEILRCLSNSSILLVLPVLLLGVYDLIQAFFFGGGGDKKVLTVPYIAL